MKRRDKRISCQYWSQKKKKRKKRLLLSDRREDTRGWKARSSKITFKPTSWHPTSLVRSTVVARNLSFCSVDLRNMGFIILILKVPQFDRSYGYCTYQKNWFFSDGSSPPTSQIVNIPGKLILLPFVSFLTVLIKFLLCSPRS